jgi:hypothetical protein
MANGIVTSYGPLADADLAGFRGWTVAVAEQAFVFLSAGSAALRESGGGALVQITGGSSRRAARGRRHDRVAEDRRLHPRDAA